MPARLLAALLLLVVATIAPAADPPARFSYGREWLDLVDSDPALTPLRPLFEQGQPKAIASLLTTVARERRAVLALRYIDDDLAARLIADLDRLYPLDPDALRSDVIMLTDLLGARRPEAVPLLLRIASENLHNEAIPLSYAAFHRPADDPAILAALVDVATGPDDRLRRAALNRLPSDDPAYLPALATVVARSTALGRYDDVRDLARTLALDPALLGAAFRTALHSSLDDTQRLQVLAATIHCGAFDRLADDHPLVHEIATLTSSPLPTRAVPGFRAILREQLAAAHALVVAANNAGEPPAPDALSRLRADPRVIADALALALKAPANTTRLAALGSLQTLDARTRSRAALTVVLDHTRRTDPDPQVRQLAAQSVGDDRAQALARIPDLIADCRADSPTLRETAARQLHDLNHFPAPVTAALLRAVAARDLPSREGLLRALERAHAAEADPVLSLETAAANPDPATRAYARAALHSLDRPH